MSHELSNYFDCMRSFHNSHKHQITSHHLDKPVTYLHTYGMWIISSKVIHNTHTKLSIVIDSSLSHSLDPLCSIIRIVTTYHLRVSMDQLTSNDLESDPLKSTNNLSHMSSAYSFGFEYYQTALDHRHEK